MYRPYPVHGSRRFRREARRQFVQRFIKSGTFAMPLRRNIFPTGMNPGSHPVSHIVDEMKLSPMPKPAGLVFYLDFKYDGGHTPKAD